MGLNAALWESEYHVILSFSPFRIQKLNVTTGHSFIDTLLEVANSINFVKNTLVTMVNNVVGAQLNATLA